MAEVQMAEVAASTNEVQMAEVSQRGVSLLAFVPSGRLAALLGASRVIHMTRSL